jgi:RHS repeat-associated protein
VRDRTVLWSLAAIVVILSSIIPGHAQQTGFPPFGSFQTGGFDGINLQDLNINFSIPVVTSPGRQLTFRLPIVNDSLIWLRGSGWYPLTDANGNPTWGWKLDFPSGQIKYTTVTVQFKCYNPGPGWFWATKTNYKDYSYTDFGGTMHWFPNSVWVDPDCWGTTTGTLTGNAYDPSGYFLDTTTPTSPVVTNPGGLKSPTASTVVDTNGNYLTQTINGSETDYTDTVGRTAAKVTTNASNITYQFLDGSGMNTYKTATLYLTSTNIKTNFACGVGEYSGTANLPTELDIPVPNSSTPLKYLFAYEPTPQNSGYFTGRLQKVTLPNGGTYEYDYGATNDGINCADGSTLNMTRKVSEGTTTGTWQYIRNVSNLTTTVTDAANNDQVYTFNSSAQETQRQMYSGTGGSRTIQRTINSTWASNGTPATQVTILEDNSTQSETDTTFDSNGLLDSMTEYDWGTGTHGPALRTTTLNYLNTTPYITRNIINRLTTKIVEDGSGTVKYRQDIAYDSVSITNHPTGVPQHDDTNYAYTMNYRGNPTSVTVYMDPVHQAQGVVTNLTYDVFGNVLTASVSGTQQKQFSFSSATQYALPDSIVSGPSPGTQLTQTLTYKSDTGLVATSKDPNNQQTSFAYDFLRRVTSATRPDNSQVTYSYDDTNHKATLTSPIDSSRSVQQIAALDGLGWPLTTTVEDGSNNIYSIVQTNYDAMGRAYRTSNPYTGSPSYWTTTSFDALSRPYQTQLPDTSIIGYSYSANTVTTTDPAGKKRKSVSDGAGRLVKVFEPDVTNGNTLTVETDYTYTVLDALATVTQGAQTRTNTYDALGRIARVSTPEAGTVCLGTYSGSNCQQNGYDNFGNLISRTDARGVVTSYAYDTLNRLIGISYPTIPSGVSAMPNTICNPTGGTANSNRCFYYDQGGQAAYAMGRVTQMVDASGSETYTYDKLGQTTQDAKVIGSTTYTTQYAYNTGGGLTQITYPSTHVVYQSYDAIGRLCEVAGSTIGTACGTATTPYVSNFGYNVASELTGLTYGNGVAASIGYSSDRLEMTSLSYAKSGTTLFGLSYSYGTSGSNNGQIAGITDSVDSGRNATYIYDALGRLTQAYTTGSTNYPNWDLKFGYDRYGNRTSETVQPDTSPNLHPPAPSNAVTVSTSTNQITTSGYQYDPLGGGNMTNDGYNTLVYDGENRATSATNGSASATYTYDANGLRVKKAVQNGTTTAYLFSGSKVVAEYENGAAPSSPTREYVYSGAALVAKIEGSSTVYYHPDQLSVRGQQSHYPFGESWYASSATTKWQFTGYERDTESGNDYAMARYDVNRLGRFNSPDPIGGSSGDPQSLNRYAYVKNDPINGTDPSGLCPRDDSWVLPSTVYAMNHGGVGKLVCSTPAVYYFRDGGAGYNDDLCGDAFCDPFNVLGDPFFGEPLPGNPSGDPWNTGCESLGVPCGMQLPGPFAPWGNNNNNCDFSGCNGGVGGNSVVAPVQGRPGPPLTKIQCAHMKTSLIVAAGAAQFIPYPPVKLMANLLIGLEAIYQNYACLDAK